MALNKISTEIIEVRIDGAEQASGQLEDIEKRLKDVEQKVKGVDSATTKAGSGFSKLQAGITTAGAAFAGLQAAAVAAGSAIQAIKAPVSLAANFQTQFAQVRTLNQSIGDDLKNQLLALAAEVPQTAGDLTQAAYQAISAGIQPTELMGFLTAASQTAVAAGGSLTEAVELLTAGVNAFGSQGETAASISNKLFATVRAGVTTIPELNAVFGRATAAASSYGVSVEEVLGAIAQLTKSGLPTSEAVTRVNATLKELSDESGTAAKALKAQGVELGVTALQQKGLVGVLEEVNSATRGQAAEIARLSGRQEAVQGMLKLTGENMESFSATVKTIRDDVSAASDANKILSDTTNNLNMRFQAAAEGALRDLGMQILPALNDLLVAMTESLGESGSAVDALGGALSLAVKAITVFVENAKLIGGTMAAAFGVKYAPAFLAQLAQMRAGLVAFNAMASATGATAGQAYGGLFKAGAMRGILSIAKAPGLIGLGVLVGQMIFSAIKEEAEQERRAIAEYNKKIATQELAEFQKREDIRQDIINKSLDLSRRRAQAEALRLEASKRAVQGEAEVAKQMSEVADAIEEAKGSTVDLTEQYQKNRQGVEQVLKVLSEQRKTFAEIAAGYREQAELAQGASEKIKILEQANRDLAEVQRESGAHIDTLRDQIEIAEQDIEIKGRQLLATQRALEQARNYAYQNIYGSEAAERLAEQERQLTKAVEDANEVLTTGSVKLYDYEQALSTVADLVDQNNASIVEESQRLAESNLQYERNKEIIEQSLTPMDRRIQQLKDAAENDKIVAQGSVEKIKAIEDALKIQIAQIKREDAEQKRQAAAYKQRVADRNRQLDALEKKQRSTAATIIATESAKEAAINDSILRQIEAQSRLELARLDADTALTPVEKLEQRLSLESTYSDLIAETKIQNIQRELESQIAASRARSELVIKDIEASKASSAIKKKQIEAETKATQASIEALKQKRDAAVSVILDERQAQEQLRQQAGEVERGDALAEEKRMAEERTQFRKDLMQTENDFSMAVFEAEREQKRIAFEDEMTRLRFAEDEKMRLREVFSAKTIELKQKEINRLRRVEDEQRRSSLSMAQEGLQNLQIAAEAAGATDSFIGKIEAAQIIAKGVYHGFQGASDQAAALSAFGLGNVAQGALLQSAAIAHFAQAAAAPIMARRALSGGGAGGAASSAGVGLAPQSSGGPRTTARAESPADQRERQQASISFGDIILADIPALLSKEGARQLGQQVASDVARELNRRRALPGGARI